MIKQIFLAIITGLIGVVATPRILAASDTVALTGLDNTGVVETIPLPEPEVTSEIKQIAVRAPEAGIPASQPVFLQSVNWANSITIAGRTLEVVSVADTSVDSGNHVNKYGEKLLYGHNSAAVFGGLVNLGAGSVFSVSEGGVTRNYRVAKVMIFEKNANTGLLQLNGAGNYMRSVANAKSEGAQYDLSLMTCYGTSYGNGDASHRLVLFASAI